MIVARVAYIRDTSFLLYKESCQQCKSITTGPRTIHEESAILAPRARSGEVGAVTVNYRLTSLQKGYLKMEVMQNLDQCFLEARNFQPVLDPTNQSDGVEFSANIFQ